MERVIVYGLGSTIKKLAQEFNLEKNGRGGVEVIAFTDSNSAYWGEERYGIPVIPPMDIPKYEYDKVIVCSIMAYEVISEKLRVEIGVPPGKVDVSYVASSTINRDKFLKCFAKMVYDNSLKGAVAECGVNEGIFARKINISFPDRTLYLFDTFEGFDKRDIDFENIHGYSPYKEGHLGNYVDENKVKALFLKTDKVVIRKGYFPDTVEGVDDEFVFVNLDFDLYKPILAGLRFFWDKMVHGGVILVHDFFNDSFMGVKAAVDEWCAKSGAAYVPIADEMSIAIIKY